MSRSRIAVHAAALSLLVTSAGVALTAGAQADEASTGSPVTTGKVSTGEGSTGSTTAGAGSTAGGAGVPDVEMDSLNVPATAPAPADRRLQPSPTEATGEPGVVAKLQTTRTDYFGLVGVTWRADYDPHHLTVQIRTHDGGDWTAWEELEVDGHQDTTDPDARGGTVPAWVGGADGIGVRLISDDGTAPTDVQVALIDGGSGLAEEVSTGSTAEGTGLPEGQVGRAAPKLLLSELTEDPTTGDTSATGDTSTEPTTTDSTTEDTSTDATTTEATAGVVPQPDIVTRAEWGVDSSTEVSCSTPRTARTMRGIILHHTAGSNDYTPEEAPGIVRGIHRYHTVARNWCDIGYNFLVDKYGVIYEGRRGGITKQVRGAHAGVWLVNKWTTGISMMGNFETAPLTEELMDSVVQLSAWRLSLFGRDALDTMLIDDVEYQRISGHRDVHATACPGKNGYYWLNNGMREQVQAVIDAAPPPTEPEPEPEPVLRYAGDSRYTTATSISEESFPEPVDAVFLASGAAFPDALSGGPAASLLDAPVLLVRPDEIPAETASELNRLQPGNIYVLGGEGAVSAGVFSQAQSYAPTVTRLSGGNRYSTGVSIARHFWSAAPTVYLASGESYPDALSGGALAAQGSAPILLSASGKLPQPVREELARLQPSTVVLLGGTGALAEQVASQVSEVLPGATTRRLAGADRYATSAEIAQYGWSTTGGRTYMAAGGNFPDALAGVPAAADAGAPLLLARQSCLPPLVHDQVVRLAPEQQILLGGSGVLAREALSTTCG